MSAGPSEAFVILHHVTRDGDHWDLMIRHGGALRTWRVPVGSVPTVDRPVPVERLGDHRLAYLDYEGPVSGDRGHVQRVDRGAAVWLEGKDSSADIARVELRGRLVNGVYRFFVNSDGAAMWGTDSPSDGG